MEDLMQTIEQNEVVMADFCAHWCLPCKDMEKVLERVELETNVSIVRVDGDSCPDLMDEYNIEGYPTIIIFRNGKMSRKLLGLHDKDTIIKALEEVKNEKQG